MVNDSCVNGPRDSLTAHNISGESTHKWTDKFSENLQYYISEILYVTKIEVQMWSTKINNIVEQY